VIVKGISTFLVKVKRICVLTVFVDDRRNLFSQEEEDKWLANEDWIFTLERNLVRERMS